MPENDSRISLLSRCYDAAKDMRERDITIPHPLKNSEISEPWYYYDRIYRGFQWDFITGMASWASRPVKNMGFIAVESYTTLLTDSSPAIVVAGRTESDQEIADVVQSGVKYWWDLENADAKVSLGVKSSRIFGIGWLHLYYDADEKRSCLRVVHPESVLVDPDTTVEDYDPAYLIYSYRCQYGELKARFKEADYSAFDPTWKLGYEYDPDRVQHDREQKILPNPAQSVQVYQMWYADPERVVFDEDIAELTVTKSKKKYPKGRVITVAGGIVLSDDENPYKHGEIPFTPIHAYPVPGRFYGIGDIQNMLNIQVMRNRMSQLLFDQTVRSGGGYVLVGQASGIDPAKLSNAPVQIVPCRDVNAFRIETARPPSRHVFDYMALLDNDADDTVGQHDISRGTRSPGNPVTAQEASILAESDRTRVRMAARWLGWALERVGNQLLSNMAQYKDFTWMVRVSDTSTRPDASAEGGVNVEPERRVPFSGKDIRLDGDKVMFDLDVVDSSTLPPSRQESYQQVQMLLQMGVLTPDDVLKYKLVDIPHADHILADREAAKAAAAAVPPQGAPAGPPPMPQQGGEMPPMPPPAAPDAAMMGAMSPVPEGMGAPDTVAIIEQIAQQQGIAPEQVIEMLMGAGQPSPM